jgi:integrase/recombinase XerD
LLSKSGVFVLTTATSTLSIPKGLSLILKGIERMSLTTLFQHFLNEKRYLQNVSSNTVEFYSLSFKTFNLPALPPTQAELNSAIVKMRESGKSIPAVNAYLRGIRPFINWLFDNGHLPDRLKLKKLKCEEKPMRTFTDAQVRAILNSKPRSKTQQRLLALLTLLTDTGVRVDEALTLTRGAIDLDNLLLTVRGKGNKTRVVPFSIECRKVLFKYMRSHSHERVFCNRHGGKLLYNNVRRDFNGLCQKLGIEGFDGSFHAFRRYFATYAIRKNTNPFVVQRQLGHASLTMTNRYAKLSTEDLAANHVSALQAGGAR